MKKRAAKPLETGVVLEYFCAKVFLLIGWDYGKGRGDKILFLKCRFRGFGFNNL